MGTIFVLLYANSEYCGFNIFGGAFKSLKTALETAQHRHNMLADEVITKQDRNVTFVLPLHNEDKDYESKQNEFETDYEQMTYYSGGYIIMETNII